MNENYQQNLKVFKKDQPDFEKDISELSSLCVRDLMNKDPLVLSADATYSEALAAFSEHHRVNPIPVVDSARRVIGVVSRFDLIKHFREIR